MGTNDKSWAETYSKTKQTYMIRLFEKCLGLSNLICFIVFGKVLIISRYV